MKLPRLLLFIFVLLAPLTLPALKFAPDAIRKCPKCAELFRERRIASGNTLGAVMWTDGKLEAPMLPDEPRLVRCRKCQTLIWVKDAQIINADGRMTRKPEWKGVERPERASESDFLSFAATVGDRERERYLRTRAWWLRNDAIRRGESAASSWTNDRKQNVERLKLLLDPKNPDQRMTLAEIEREIGNFEASLKILEESFPDRYRAAVAFLRKLATEKSTDVATFPKQ
jgi:hypothetical protein